MKAAAKDVHRILIVDDHPVFRDGLGQLISRETDLKVCGEAGSVQEALRAIETTTPDMLIVDISLAGSSGIDLIKQVRTRYEDLPILVISMHDESLYAERAIRTGAMGYVMKQEVPKSIKLAIRKVLAGEIYLSEKMSARMASRFRAGAAGLDSPVERLSDRELEVFRLIGQGKGTRQIAEELGLSIPTINSFRARIKEKLNLGNASELVLHAIHWVQQGG